MLLRNCKIENVKSFLDPVELKVEGEIAIVIGPNGGGKTNLLDTIVTALRRFILGSVWLQHSPIEGKQNRHVVAGNDQVGRMLLERHSAADPNRQQVIEIELEVTARDVENMNAMKNESPQMREKVQANYEGYNFDESVAWTLSGIAPGERFTFRIVNGGLQPNDKTGFNEFLRYLQLFELDRKFREEFGLKTLASPMLYLPVTRTAHGVATAITVHSFNEHEAKRMVDAATSKNPPPVVNLAIGRIADKYHMLLQKDDGKANEMFRSDENLSQLSEILKELGYEWELETVNFRKSEYDLKLKKHGSSFLVGAASSGEKELLTYLLAIYALDVRNTLIVVDEPELHLHPKWQRILLSLFERLAKKTGNQFLFSTHSPTFVSPASIQHVSRVYSENQKSKVHRLDTTTLPSAKHLLKIVNSQNNEKLFFADKVILVEGVSDRIFFEAIFTHLGKMEYSGSITEIVEVGGKTLFHQYEKLLKASAVPFDIIADLDYVDIVGTEPIKKLFQPSSQAIKVKVLDDATSTDGTTLVNAIETALANKNWDHATSVWEYIKSKRIRLKNEMTADEEKLLDEFLVSQATKGTYILKRGSLEDYLPDGHKSKDIERLLTFLDGDFWSALDKTVQAELTALADALIPSIKIKS